jgi:beta-fructofuranosidase
MLHFQPNSGRVGDVIPFFHHGMYHAFFLTIHDDQYEEWGHAVSTDLFHWEERPLAITRGTSGPDQQRCLTGSVLFAQEQYWMFYTGERVCAEAHAQERDQHRQTHPTTICLATSVDAEHWEKYQDNPVVLRDLGKYAWGDWRDPFVFYHDAEQCYWMTITARLYDQPDGFGGCVALAKSHDLRHWDICDPIYAPGNTYPPECTDLFCMGDYWYLLYSYELTRYCIGPSPAGPWRQVQPHTFDGRSVYASKTLWDGHKRYLLGDLCSRAGETDAGAWRGGGCMTIPRELVQGPDGALYTKLPAVYEQYFRAADAVNLAEVEVQAGSWHLTPGGMSADPGLFAKVLLPGRYPAFYLEATLAVTPQTRLAGVYVNDGDYFQNRLPYQVTLDFVSGDVLFSHKYRGANAERITSTWADLTTERAVKVQIIVEGTTVEIFVDDKFSLATRAYDDLSLGRIGFFVENGALTVRDVRVMPLC